MPWDNSGFRQKQEDHYWYLLMCLNENITLALFFLDLNRVRKLLLFVHLFRNSHNEIEENILVQKPLKYTSCQLDGLLLK